MIVIQFSTQKGFGSWLIRWLTWSDWSHVDFVLPDGTLLGARLIGGVKVRRVNYLGKSAKKARFAILGAPDSVIERAYSQIGKPYDWRGILNFALHRNWRETDSWFCDELVAWCCEQQGTPLLNPATPVRRLTPRDLTLSVRLSGTSATEVSVLGTRAGARDQ